ncbi:hypothetical protein VYU27_002477 [Nannochloropsis oceanica]
MTVSWEIIVERDGKNSNSTNRSTSSTDLADLLHLPACPRLLGVANATALAATQTMTTVHNHDVEENKAETPSSSFVRLLSSSLVEEPVDRSLHLGAKRPRATETIAQPHFAPAVTTKASFKFCRPLGGTGLYYDAVHQRHHHPGRKHPERPERVEAIMSHLACQGLLDKLTLLQSADRACYDSLESVHSTYYLQRLRRLEALSSTISDTDNEGRGDEKFKEKMGGVMARLQEEAAQFDSVYLNESTIECARKAAGGLMLLVEAVMTSRSRQLSFSTSAGSQEGILSPPRLSLAESSNCNVSSTSIITSRSSTTSHSLPPLRNGLALIRPPGHHAEAHHARGFCLLNNVAIAAQFARQRLGVSKILICDWDVHHGQGTQQMFWKDKSVLYFSVHRYDNGSFFPGTGSPKGVGEGEGEGYTINVAWNEGGMGDREYREVWRRVLLPVARAFEPELILVSAGFDGAKGDGMGGCEVTGKGGFGWMTQRLVREVESAQGRVVLALEGGYKLSVLGECVEACLGGLMEKEGGEGGDEETNEDTEEEEIREEATEAIARTIAVHRKYWPCLGGGLGDDGHGKEGEEVKSSKSV